MSTEKAKELKWYKDIVRYIVWYKKMHTSIMNPDYNKQYHEITNFVESRYPYYEGIDKALSELEQPVCKTCKGTGVVCDDEDLGGHAVTNMPCPDCQKPEPSEFTKGKRKKDCDCELCQAYDIIDRLEAENERLKENNKSLKLLANMKLREASCPVHGYATCNCNKDALKEKE